MYKANNFLVMGYVLDVVTEFPEFNKLKFLHLCAMRSIVGAEKHMNVTLDDTLFCVRVKLYMMSHNRLFTYHQTKFLNLHR